ncbi:DUF6371 domain-containing protein [Bizionia sp.]|uniref:DUF6371 domain-containing protein n=1 Tax=Bizionia sp. TaxID=1954480 RepID=UPI003A8CB5DA
MLKKKELNLSFNTKRNRNIITPCCKSHNKDGKFATYKNLPPVYGYCHSCGIATLPPTRYTDESGNEFIWNDNTKKMEPTVTNLYDGDVIQMYDNVQSMCVTVHDKPSTKQQFIDFKIVNLFYKNSNENNLLLYLRKQFGNTKTDLVKAMYYIGTTKDSGTVFWSINKNNQPQKAKVSYYKPNGKRTTYFKVPYKNEDGYYSCLFGEHLLDIPENKNKAVILVESEKTAIACAMHYPEYVWLAYGGITALTNDKIQVLKGRKVILIPDMSEKAVEIMNKKLIEFETIEIDAKVWDLTSGKTDEALKEQGWYNCDLEDVLSTTSS